MTGILKGIADVIFPPRCTACAVILETQGTLPFCPDCSAGIRFIGPPLCARCGMPFSFANGADPLCGDCVVTPRPFAVARAVGLYEETLLTVIHLFKYRGRTGLGKVLGGIMADFAASTWDMTAFSLIIPVPLHKKRLRERGFNQAVLLARVIARRFDLPLEITALTRAVHTKPQVGLGHSERAANVEGAFAVRKPARTAGQRILLVDDVYTTGSTLAACARALLDTGADSVAVLTLARALRGRDLPDMSIDPSRSATGE